MDPEFGHFESEMNRGFLQLFVLGMLDSPTYGYRMLKTCEGLGYRVEENTLYPLLRRLERMELIQGEWNVTGGRPRKFYVITPLGRDVRVRLLDIRRAQNKILEKLEQGNREEDGHV